MKLVKFTIKHDYLFNLHFENGKNKTIDLSELIKNKISKDDIKTANIDKDWGCLEFKDSLIDIEPKTL